MEYGCKFGMPHEVKAVFENRKVKCEICIICGEKFRWHKRKGERINNTEYLKVHARNFAQKFGNTKRLYNKVYHPNKCIIKI